MGSIADPALEADRPAPSLGRVVVCGNATSDVSADVLRTLRETGLVPLAADGPVTPRLISAFTRAVVFVVDDVDSGLRACEELREWAHESLLPIVVVFAGQDSSQAAELWSYALTVVRRWELTSLLVPLLGALDARRDGLPTDRDVELAWEGRCVLRQPPWSLYAEGLATFAAADTLFVGGLAPDEVAVRALHRGLDIPRAHVINFAALRVWNTSGEAQTPSEGTN